MDAAHTGERCQLLRNLRSCVLCAGMLGRSVALYKHFYLMPPVDEIAFLTQTLVCLNLSVVD